MEYQDAIYQGTFSVSVWSDSCALVLKCQDRFVFAGLDGVIDQSDGTIDSCIGV